jgi:hypothetical protein
MLVVVVLVGRERMARWLSALLGRLRKG